MIEVISIFFLAWAILLVGYLILKDFTTTVLGALLFICIGSYGISYGLFGINNPINTGFSLIHMGLGLYWIVKASIKLSKDPVVKIFDLRKLKFRRCKNGFKETVNDRDKAGTTGRTRTDVKRK
jgi:hypothetical protein